MTSHKVNGSDDLILFKPSIHCDNRLLFLERFNIKDFKKATGLSPKFLQSNESYSSKNVLRGLHYQLNKPQGKLVSVFSGKVLDVVVDLRVHSKTYGKCFKILLDSNKKYSLWIPRGYAHGFLTLSKDAIFFYMVDNSYDPASEHTILWNDPSLNINWNVSSPIVSEKDMKGITFNAAPKFP